MTKNGLLGLAVIVFCVAGVSVGIVRLAPGRSAADLGLAMLAAVLGAVACVVILRVGRRGSPPWTKWLIVPVLVAALYVNRLEPRWKLALLALGGGYVAAFLGAVIVRLVRLTR